MDTTGLTAYLIVHDALEFGTDRIHRTFLDMDHVETSSAEVLRDAIAWVESKRALNKDGLLEMYPRHERHMTESEKGKPLSDIRTGEMKDAWDCFFYPDGSPPHMPVASLENNCQLFAMYREGAELAQRLGPVEAAKIGLDRDTLYGQAAEMQKIICNKFFVEDGGGFFAIGTDRNPATGEAVPLAIKTSSVAAPAFWGVLDEDLSGQLKHKLTHYKACTAEQLLDSRNALIWHRGIRSLTSDSNWGGVLYAPTAYWNGKDWPVQTERVVEGLHRIGHHGGAWEVAARNHAKVDDTKCYPEAVPSSGRRARMCMREVEVEGLHGIESSEIPDQEIQGWTVIAIRREMREWAKVRLGREDALPLEATDQLVHAHEQHLLQNLARTQELLFPHPAIIRGITQTLTTGLAG